MRLLLPMAKEFVTITHGNTARAMRAEDLAELLRGITDLPVTAAESIEEGCRLALEKTGRDGVLCAIGSLYQVGDVTRELKRLLG